MVFASLYSILPNACFALAHGVLPDRFKNFKVAIPISNSWAIVVREHEITLVRVQKVTQAFVRKSVMMHRKISHWIEASEHLRIFSKVVRRIAIKECLWELLEAMFKGLIAYHQIWRSKIPYSFN